MSQPHDNHEAQIAEMHRKADAFARRVYAEVWQRFEALRTRQTNPEPRAADDDAPEPSDEPG